MSATQTKGNQSLEKGLLIMEVMADAGKPLQLTDIAAKSGLPASTALRMIKTMQNCGYVHQNPESLKYTLTLKITQLGNSVSSRFQPSQLTHPHLIELSQKCRESCCMAVEINSELVYVDVVDGPDNMLTILQRIGKRAPLYSTGIGKLLLLNYTPEMIHEYVAKVGLKPLTANTVTNEQQLLERLALIRQQGFALDDEECELGARCVAAPVYDFTNSIVAGISVSGPVTRLTEERITAITPIVCQTAATISRLLSYKA